VYAHPVSIYLFSACVPVQCVGVYQSLPISAASVCPLASVYLFNACVGQFNAWVSVSVCLSMRRLYTRYPLYACPARVWPSSACVAIQRVCARPARVCPSSVCVPVSLCTPVQRLYTCLARVCPFSVWVSVSVYLSMRRLYAR
jgi:hypothetical protein